MPTRRHFLGISALAAQKVVVRAENAKPLNFVFLLADDLGWADTGVYGADLHETPNIDRLAAAGVRFTDAYAAAPVCSPTRASIMTGKCPARLHMTIWREAVTRPPADRRLIPPVGVEDLPHEEVTLAEVLHDSGYLAAHVGKWHLGGATHYPETQGFDVNIGGTLWGAPQTYFYPYRGTRRYGGEFRYVPHLEWGKSGEYLTDRLTSEALNIVERVKDRPFYLNLAWHSVHTPVEGKPEFVSRYKARVKPGMHHKNAGYAAMVRSLDENVGRVLDTLDRLGIADRTVVVFTSDNGGYINAFDGQPVTDNYPLRSGKGSLYEGGVRVPLIIRWPGVAHAGVVCREPVISHDFYPTIIEMAGLGRAKQNATVDGISLTPLLRDPRASLDRDALFFHYPHYYTTTTPASAIRSREWKLIEYFEDGHLELYNLKKDPGEKNNLANSLPGQAAELHTRLRAWRESVNAQMPRPNPVWKAS